MPKIKILSDSASDLSPALLARYQIEIIPFYINLGERILRDGIDIRPTDIYEFVRRNKILPGTIACSVDDFRQAFAKWRGMGYEVICHTISSEMSCSFQNARIAAEDFDGVYVVDSRNLSSGEGHVVLGSAILAEQGLTASEIMRELDRLIPRVRASFILDNLDYMRKGGRCSSVAVLGANLLHIKPEIEVLDGVMKVGTKFRGPLQKVLTDYVNKRLSDPASIRSDRIFITHSVCPKELIDAVRACIESAMHFDEIIETDAGCTVNCHCGPNTIGILYIEK